MADSIKLFGERLQTPQALRQGLASPRPGPWNSQWLALGVTATLLVTSLGLLFLLQGGDEGPGGPYGPGGDLAPLGERQRTSPQLVGFDSCTAMETELKQHISEEMLVTLDQNRYSYRWGWFGIAEGDEDAVYMTGSPTPEAADSGQAKRVEGEDYSGTNNQEAGVDEADFVKTDGYYIYLINGNNLEILGVPEFGQLVYESNLTLEGNPTQMLMANDFLVVFSSIYAYNLPEGDPLRDLLITDSENYWWRTTSLTKVTVIDVADRTAPQVARELFIEGYYKTAREVDNTVRLVTYGYLDTPGLRYWPEVPDKYYELDWDDPARQAIWNASLNQTIQNNLQIIEGYALEDLVPQIYLRTPGGPLQTQPFVTGQCGDFVMASDTMSRGFTSILTLDLFSDTFDFEADHIMSNWAEVYASRDVLLIAERAQDWWWYWGNSRFLEATNIHSFDISEPGRTFYTGSGRVNGTVLDQFSLSEYKGFLRVASTTGQWNRWWLDASERQGPENHVWVLAPAATLEGQAYLAQIGHLGGIAVGERIWSTRFVADKAYMVTFRNMDPLWTIDLSTPTHPKIMGELEVPGVSTYIHPLDENYLLTIGIGPGNEGQGLDWRVTQLSQFNVTNFSDPQLLSALPLTPVSDDGSRGWSWSSSEATYEHKAFQYWAPKGLLAVPLSTYRYVYEEDEERGKYYGHYEYVSKLVLVNAVPGQELSFYGEVNHSAFYDDSDNSYWNNYGFNIRRSIFMGDYIYAISAGGVTVHRLADMELQVAVKLNPGWEDRYYILEG